jgi:hypothetical protein
LIFQCFNLFNVYSFHFACFGVKLFQDKTVFNSQTQSYVAPNFNIKDYIVVKELPAVSPNENSKLKSIAPGGMIVDTRLIHIGANGAPEQYATVPSGYIVTGVGANIKSSNSNYNSILLAFRYLYSNGTLGPRYLVYSGDNIQPSALEAWYEVPSGAVVWGLGIRGKYDVLNMSVYYRYIDQTTLRLTGSYGEARVGLQPNGVNTITYWPQENGLDQDRAIIQGIGLTSHDKSVGTDDMQFDVGYIK